MSKPEVNLDRLLRAAAKQDEPALETPFGFATRVVALANMRTPGNAAASSELAQVGPTLDETSQLLRTIRTETTARVSEVMEDSHRRMGPYLTPEQQAKIEKMKERHLRVLHHFGGPEAPPPPEE